MTSIPPDRPAAGAGLLAVGETMALVTPATGHGLVDAEDFHLDAGGAESNVATHVAALGYPARWFSRLGDDALGRRVAAQLERRGVDVSTVVMDASHRTGVYFKDPGSAVLYYRSGSAASHLSPADAEVLDFAGIGILHVSGITAAISGSAASFLDSAIGRAREAGVRVSFDVNDRRALWDAATAAGALAALARRADLVFVGRDEAESLWGTERAQDVRALFPDVPELVVKDGEVGATVFAGGLRVFEPSFEVRVVDVVGAGDAFAGGYLAAVLAGAPHDERLRAGHGRAALTLQTTGDFIDERIGR